MFANGTGSIRSQPLVHTHVMKAVQTRERLAKGSRLKRVQTNGATTAIFRQIVGIVYLCQRQGANVSFPGGCRVVNTVIDTVVDVFCPGDTVVDVFRLRPGNDSFVTRLSGTGLHGTHNKCHHGIVVIVSILLRSRIVAGAVAKTPGTLLFQDIVQESPTNGS